MDSVISFTDEYAFLSNSYMHPITYDGLTYMNAEAAFWAQKIKDLNARKKYTRLSGQKARAKAAQCESVPDWENLKDSIMKDILRVKFSDQKLRKALLNTKPKALINITNFRDTYWGRTTDSRGENKLGKFLEEIRDNY